MLCCKVFLLYCMFFFMCVVNLLLESLFFVNVLFNLRIYFVWVPSKTLTRDMLPDT